MNLIHVLYNCERFYFTIRFILKRFKTIKRKSLYLKERERLAKSINKIQGVFTYNLLKYITTVQQQMYLRKQHTKFLLTLMFLWNSLPLDEYSICR